MRTKILIASIGLVVACSGKKFSGSSTTAPGPETPKPAKPNAADGESPAKPNPSSPTLVEKCVKEAAKLQTVTKDINFAAREGCTELDGEAGKANRKQVTVTAAEIQNVNLDLPTGTICSLTIDSDEGEITYDDFLVLTIENKVLFSSNRFLTDNLTKKDGVFEWDFSKVKTGEALGDAKWVAGPYCLGGKTCTLPKSEDKGRFDIKFDTEDFAPISIAIEGKSSVPVTLTSTGDDDDFDCGHTGVNLRATIKYLSK